MIAGAFRFDPRRACRDVDRDTFFVDGERGFSKDRAVAAAKNVCRSCPFIDECAQFALDSREPFGVWGGVSEEERRDELRRLGRRNPRLVAA